MGRRLITIVCALVLLATPAYATRLYQSTYRFSDTSGPLYRFDDTSFNLIHQSLDSRIDTLEDGTTGSYSFKTFTVSGQESVVADAVADSIDFEAGDNITITTDSDTKTITITGAAGGGGDVDSLSDLDDVSGIAYGDGNVLRGDGGGFVEAVLDHSDLDLDDGLNPHSLTPAELGAVDIAGDTMTGLLTLSGSATADLHAVTKVQMETYTQGFSVRTSCRVTSTGNVDEDNDLENGDTFNNLTLATDDRILLKDQADASENGIYVVQASGAAPRATDYDETGEVTNGSYTFVWDTDATAYGATAWVLVTADPITVDTTDLTFTTIASAGTYAAGDGLDLTAGTFSTDLASSGGLEISGTELQIKLDGSGLATGAGGISLNTIAGSDLNELGDVNAGAPSDGQQLTWDDGTSKWVAAGAGGSGSSGGNVITEVTFVVFSRGTSTVVQWNNLPSAPGELFNSIASRKHMDLSAATEYRVVASMFTLGYAGTDLNLYYSTDNSTYQVADEGGGEGELDISGGLLGFRKGSWASLVTGAKTTNSYISIVGKDGNNAVDPRFAWLAVQFKFPAGVITDESLQDKVGAMWTGNTETRIAVTYQDADGTFDAVVEDDLTAYDWTSVSSTELTAARIEDAFLRNNIDDITTGSLTLDDGTGDSPSLILKDATDNTVSWTKLDAGGSEITDSGALLFKVSADADDYMKMITTANAPEFTFVGANGLITASGGNISFSNENLATTGTLATGVATVTGVINTSVGLDAVGAVDMDYGSGDVTDHTFSTDGTGDTEIVLPDNSIGDDEIDWFGLTTSHNFNVTGLILTTAGIDAVGAVDMDYGSNDVTDHTFITNSTGDSEMVLPDDSIGPAEIDSTTGDYDFGDVTSLTIPSANDVTANTGDGKLSWDKDDKILYIGDGTNLVALGGGSETVNEFHIDYVVPATAFSLFTALDIVADVDAQAATSHLHVIDIDAVGTQAGEAVAIATHGDIDVLEQYTGTWVSLDQTTPDADAGEIPNAGSWSDGLHTTLFEADEDEIYIKAPNDGKFSAMRVILSTPSSSHISQAGGLVIEYQHTDTTWDTFTPIDGTAGFQQSGTIIWDADNLTNWKSDSDPGGVDGEEGYWIRIRRTRNSIGTDAVATTIETREAVIYGWNAAAQITVTALVANSLDADGAVDLDIGSGDVLDITLTTDDCTVIIDAGITVSTGDTITLGTTAWNSGDDIDGEQIADNTIDEDSPDWGSGAGQIDADDVPESTTLRFVHIGTSFPGGPSEGDFFYHQTHDTLFQFENAAWNPIINHGAPTLDLYVNAGAGSDAIGQGYGSGADATATIQYCWDNCIPKIYAGTITITIAAGTYVEELVLAGKEKASATASITIIGTLLNQTSGTASAGAATTLTDAGETWANNEFQYDLLRLTGGTGDGQYAWIASNTDAEVATIMGKWNTNPAGDTTYSIDQLGTIINGGAGNRSIYIVNMSGLTLKYIESDTAKRAFYAEGCDDLNFIGCRATGAGITVDGWWIERTSLGTTATANFANNIGGTGFKYRGVHVGYNTRFAARSCGSYGFNIDQNSFVHYRYSYTDANTNRGVSIDNMSAIEFVDWYINNETVGVSINGKSLGKGITTSITFNACTTDYSLDWDIKAVAVTIDPGTHYNLDTDYRLFSIGDEAPNGIIITKWKVGFGMDPDVEVDMDLCYADDWAETGETVIDALDTTNGTSSENTPANINGGVAIANGKYLYLRFGADPEGDGTQMTFEFWYYAEED